MVCRKVVIPMVLIVTSVIAGAGLFRWHSRSGQGWGNRPFDQTQWKAARHWNPDNVRGKMVRRLLQDYRLKGMTRKEVLALLGPPDGANGRIPDSLKIPNNVAHQAHTLHWVLGMWSGFGMDYDTLDLQFDESGRVVRWAIVQH